MKKCGWTVDLIAINELLRFREHGAVDRNKHRRDRLGSVPRVRSDDVPGGVVSVGSVVDASHVTIGRRQPRYDSVMFVGVTATEIATFFGATTGRSVTHDTAILDVCVEWYSVWVSDEAPLT